MLMIKIELFSNLSSTMIQFFFDFEEENHTHRSN